MPSNYQNVSAIPTQGVRRTYKRGMRMERAARLHLDPAGYTIQEIASMMGVAPITVSQWRMDPYYHNIMIQIKTGVIAEDDRILKQNTDLLREELEEMLPVALQQLRNSLYSNSEAIRMKAIEQVLDRDGKFAKVSKTSVTHEVKPDLNDVNKVGLELAALLSQGTATGFSVSADQAERNQQKLNVSAATSLEDIDLSGTTKQ